MARAWIEDLWLTDATVTMPDGSVVKTPPSAAMKRSLAAHPDDPLKARVPQEYRTARYGKGKRWRVNWRAACPDGVTKKKTKAFSDYKNAESFVAAMEDDIRAGRYIDPRDGERRFGDVAQLWLAAQGNVKGSTYNRYTRELKYYIYPRWQHVAIASITQDDVIAWVHALQQATAPVNFNTARRPHPLGPSSIRNIVKVIFGGILKFAADPHRRWILFNPVDGIKLPKAATNQTRIYLTMNEIMAIADAAATVTSPKTHQQLGGLADRLMILTMGLTGLRPGEAIALRVGDIDVPARRINVTKTVSEEQETGLPIETTPKSCRPRKVPIPLSLLNELKPLLDGRSDDEYLFTSKRNCRISLNTWRARIWKPAIAAVGLDDVEGLSIKTLRHSYASIAIAHGTDVKALQTSMGHASAAMTLDVYADLWPDRLDVVNDAIDAAYMAMNQPEQ